MMFYPFATSELDLSYLKTQREMLTRTFGSAVYGVEAITITVEVS